MQFGIVAFYGRAICMNGSVLLAFIGGLRDPVSSVCLPLHFESDAKIKLTVRPIHGVIAQTHSYRCVEIIQSLISSESLYETE